MKTETLDKSLADYTEKYPLPDGVKWVSSGIRSAKMLAGLSYRWSYGWIVHPVGSENGWEIHWAPYAKHYRGAEILPILFEVREDAIQYLWAKFIHEGVVMPCEESTQTTT